MSISHTLIGKSVDSSENSRRAGELAVRPSRQLGDEELRLRCARRRKGDVDDECLYRRARLRRCWSARWPAGGVTEPPRLDGRNINRNRALLIRRSKKPENHLALLLLACGLIAFKKAHAARLAHALPE